KSEAMVKWINEIESDGVTKIDGIGSQMHVSYSCDPTEQKRREDAVVKSLKTLAASGKLVRITELDMGIDDAEGKSINTADVTLEQHKAMGEYYKFIIKSYFENIPVAQQYGICHWAQTDSPSGSGWRANCPIGLWTEYNAAAGSGFSRKPAYGSFCDALAGK
ncbi:MAG: endo-1,4-beta-xylanase, partial [Muribaculaceae bacterium]|nr:endo-1,4-beta-xylanase [Muribaculaceae bacterium]